MSTKFQLQPKPTFKADVTIPRAGDEPGILTFTFKHKPLDELTKIEALEGMAVTDFLLDVIDGWALPDEFCKENLQVLINNYPAAASAVTEAYYREILGHREKN